MTTIRIGLIGASPGSNWGYSAHVPAIASVPGLRVSAVATTREASATEAARLLGADAWFTDVDALANSEHVDVVAVSVKVPAHQKAIEAALKAGKPVYCEWPLSLDAVQARAAATLARERGVLAAVGLQARQNPTVAHLARLIEGGSLGEIRAIEAHATRARGLATRRVTRSGAYTLDAANGAGTREVLGGHLLGLVDRLERVVSLSGTALAPQPETLTDDEGNVHRVTTPDTFVANGRLRGGGLLSMSWWDRDPDPRVRVVVHGTLSKAVLETPEGLNPALVQPQMAPLRLRLISREGDTQVVEPEASDLTLVAQNVAAAWRCFADDLRNGTAFSATFDDAVRLHELLDAGVPRTVE